MNITTDIIGNEPDQEYSIRVVCDTFKVGDYVFLSKYGDADPNDPWCVGLIDEIGIDRKGGFVRCFETGQRYWRNAVKIDKDTGDKILSALANYRLVEQESYRNGGKVPQGEIIPNLPNSGMPDMKLGEQTIKFDKESQTTWPYPRDRYGNRYSSYELFAALMYAPEAEEGIMLATINIESIAQKFKSLTGRELYYKEVTGAHYLVSLEEIKE